MGSCSSHHHRYSYLTYCCIKHHSSFTSWYEEEIASIKNHWHGFSQMWAILQKPTLGVLITRRSENMRQIHRRIPLPKCNFNKVTKRHYWNHTSALAFSSKFALYFQNTFSEEHFWRAASVTSCFHTSLHWQPVTLLSTIFMQPLYQLNSSNNIIDFVNYLYSIGTSSLHYFWQ